MDLPLPTQFAHWDPLLQRMCSAPPPVAAQTAPFAVRPVRPMRARAKRQPDALSTPVQRADPTNCPTPAELEEQSLALAFRLQQEEERDFMHAMRSSTPASTAASTPHPGGMRATPGTGGDDIRSTYGRATGGRGERESPASGGDVSTDDASLQLALRLQEEELQWQRLNSQRNAAIHGLPADDLDEATLLAMQLSQAGS